MLIYLAYFVLRNSIDDREKRARIAAVYNIFAFIMLIVFLMIYPRMNQVDSLHPGNGGNPGFSVYESELDNRMRRIFLSCCFWMDHHVILDNELKSSIGKNEK